MPRVAEQGQSPRNVQTSADKTHEWARFRELQSSSGTHFRQKQAPNRGIPIAQAGGRRHTPSSATGRLPP
jgi:hypothetical protein